MRYRKYVEAGLYGGGNTWSTWRSGYMEEQLHKGATHMEKWLPARGITWWRDYTAEGIHGLCGGPRRHYTAETLHGGASIRNCMEEGQNGRRHHMLREPHRREITQAKTARTGN